MIASQKSFIYFDVNFRSVFEGPIMAASLNNVLQKMDPGAVASLLDEILKEKEPKNVKVFFQNRFYVQLPVNVNC